MKIKIKILSLIILISLLATTFMSGCSSVDNSDILRPPRATGEKAYIENIIKIKAGGDYTLKYPKSGDYRSAIILQDIDNDGIEEAIALYKPSGELSITHILFMKQINGQWKEIGDYEGISNNIDEISLADIDGDGKNEVAVSYLSSVSTLKQMAVYVIEEVKTKYIEIKNGFNDFVIMNIDDERKDSILMMSLATQDVDASASLIQYSTEKEKMFVRSVVSMDSSVIQYSLVQSGFVNEEIVGVFVDGELNENGQVTQLIYWDDKTSTLLNPLYEKSKEEGVLTNETIRIGTVNCNDIDGDAITEIPTIRIFPLEEKESLTSACGLTAWNEFNVENKVLLEKLQTVIMITDGYYFSLPKKWANTVTARQDLNTRTVTFYEWLDDSDTPKKGQELLTIKAFTIKDWQSQEETEDYIEMITVPELVYAVKIPTGSTSDLTLTLEEISQNLKLIE